MRTPAIPATTDRFRTKREHRLDRTDMPYTTNEDLPTSIKGSLPPHAQGIFRAAFNSAWTSYGKTDPAHREEIAHRVAWAAVKRRYRKLQGQWVPISG